MSHHYRCWFLCISSLVFQVSTLLSKRNNICSLWSLHGTWTMQRVWWHQTFTPPLREKQFLRADYAPANYGCFGFNYRELRWGRWSHLYDNVFHLSVSMLSNLNDIWYCVWYKIYWQFRLKYEIRMIRHLVNVELNSNETPVPWTRPIFKFIMKNVFLFFKDPMKWFNEANFFPGLTFWSRISKGLSFLNKQKLL